MSEKYSLSNFANRYWTSPKYVSYVSHLLYLVQGIWQILPPNYVRKVDERPQLFAKVNDIYVSAELKTGLRLGIEVKSKNEEFTGDPSSWPFNDVTVCNVNKLGDPFAVVLVSAVTKEILVVLRDDTWFKRPQRDSDPTRGGLEYEVWAVPVTSLLTWDQFIVKLCAALGLPAPEPRAKAPEPAVVTAMDLDAAATALGSG